MICSYYYGEDLAANLQKNTGSDLKSPSPYYKSLFIRTA